MSREFLGIDIGGTGIKIGLADVSQARMASERFKVLTPKPSTPDAVADTVIGLINREFPDYEGPIGCGMPCKIIDKHIKMAANLHHDWIGRNVQDFFREKLNRDVFLANDADVAAIAEICHHDNMGQKGLVIFLTIGTGIGSALFYNGQLLANTELGHLLYEGDSYEKYASNAARKREDLSWQEWGKRFGDYLNHLTLLFSPELIILGGGVSKKFHKFEEYLQCDTEIKPAILQNEAGVIGAAILASKNS